MGRRFSHRLLFGIAFAAATLLGTFEVAAQQTITVRPGDALSTLAQRFGVSVEDLHQWNELDGDQIQAGQALVVAEDERSGDTSDTTSRPVYEVQTGDTLSAIALRLGLSIDQIIEYNEGLSADSIRVGQRLVVGNARHRIEHTVRRGESLSRIADRYDVKIRDIMRWNPRDTRHVLRAGAKILVWSDRPGSRSEAEGLPHAGRLLHGERLPRHSGYVIRDRDRAWGTRETNDAIVGAFDSVAARHRRSPRLRVHDLSARQGGRMSDHRSHQNGRDADISYFQRRGCPADGCGFRRLRSDDLDVARTWTLLSYWLERDVAKAIFIDYSLQGALYREARRRGATAEQLHHWFQYPRGVGFPLGTIRHFPHHRDHLHLRLRCADGDEECR